MKIGYARVSSDLQVLDLQIDALEKYGCERIFTEHATGTKKDRPEFNKVLQILRKSDTIIVWRLDRLGRRVKDLIDIVDKWEKDGVDFVSIQDNIDTSTTMGRFFFHVMAAIAEMERDLIRDRVMAGLAAAKSRGKKGGRRPKLSNIQEKQILILHKNPTICIDDICKQFDISRSTLYNCLRKQREQDKSQQPTAQAVGLKDQARS
jgi:DNA invertase Pin-like site-specific DNA recombinase